MSYIVSRKLFILQFFVLVFQPDKLKYKFHKLMNSNLTVILTVPGICFYIYAHQRIHPGLYKYPIMLPLLHSQDNLQHTHYMSRICSY